MFEYIIIYLVIGVILSVASQFNPRNSFDAFTSFSVVLFWFLYAVLGIIGLFTGKINPLTGNKKFTGKKKQ